MTKKFAFTEAAVKALSPPDTGRVYHKDTRLPGLQVCVTSAGTKTYYFVKRIGGKPARVRLGAVGQLSVEKARKAAATVTGEVAAGRDPQQANRARRHELTMGDLLAYWKEYAQAHKKSWREDDRICKRHFEKWSGRKLSSIKRAEVQKMHLQLKESAGPYMANRVHELLRAMYNRAKDDLGYTGDNPAIGIKRFREVKRDRFLHGDELKAFFEALEAEPDITLRNFFWLSLLTGARQGNVQAMRWDEIDWQAALWRIPETKSGLPVVVPLTATALQVLVLQREISGSPEWVFPSRRGGHIAEPKFAWARIVKRAGLSDVRPHDLRRSLGSWMAMTGAGLPVVGKMLGHSQPSTTAIYARLAVDPVRQAAEMATAAMLAAGGVKMLEVEGGRR